MGKRGPAPKPTRLKVLEGTFRADRAPEAEVHYSEGVPSCPAHLGPAAKEEWKRIIPELSKVPGLLQLVDRAVVAGYCSNFALWAHAEDKMREDGLVVEYETKGGAVMSQQTAWVGIRNQALAQMLQYAQQLGFSPASRTRVGTGGGKKGKGQTEAERLASKYLG